MVDPDLMPQKVASDQGLHCLPLIQQFLDSWIGSKMDFFKFYNKYGKEFRLHMLIHLLKRYIVLVISSLNVK